MSTPRYVVHAAIAASAFVWSAAQADHVRVNGQINIGSHYPARGYVTGSLPHGSLSIAFGGGHHYYHRGVWYRP